MDIYLLQKTCKDNSLYTSNCKFEEYVDYKMKLLSDLAGIKSYIANNGYSKTGI